MIRVECRSSGELGRKLNGDEDNRNIVCSLQIITGLHGDSVMSSGGGSRPGGSVDIEQTKNTVPTITIMTTHSN